LEGEIVSELKQMLCDIECSEAYTEISETFPTEFIKNLLDKQIINTDYNYYLFEKLEEFCYKYEYFYEEDQKYNQMKIEYYNNENEQNQYQREDDKYVGDFDFNNVHGKLEQDNMEEEDDSENRAMSLYEEHLGFIETMKSIALSYHDNNYPEYPDDEL